jgi:hypothetical protein
MKKSKKQEQQVNKPINFVVRHSWNKSGAGAHPDETKYNRKQKHKRSGKDLYYYKAA